MSPEQDSPVRRSVILVVDDSPQSLQSLHSLLVGEAEVLFATSGQEALELSYLTLPDLILMDAVMPGMDGYETCQRFRENPATADLPVIFLSGLDEPADQTRGLALGALDFIHKPFNPAILLAKVRSHLRAKGQLDIYKHLAQQDALTGLPNRRSFDATLSRDWENSARGRAELSLLMVDVDLFKAFNDHLGHAEGDHCLRRVGQALAGALPRKLDFLARYGGEEFAAILPATSVAGALRVAEHLRAAVEAMRIPAPFTPAGHVTVSLGVAAMLPDPEDRPEKLVVLADRGLYRAKANGRNRVALELPAGAAADPPTAPGRPQPLVPEVARLEPGPPVILLVDDDPRMRLLMEGRLACLGITLAMLPEAQSAAAMLARQTPDLILSDVVMPGMDGFEFCRRCKQDPRLDGVPFILLTALSRDLRERALAAGADDYLSKMEQEHIFRMRVRTGLELGLHRAPAPAPAGSQLLVVTGSPAIHQMIAAQMSPAGIQVRQAEAWGGALDALRAAPADLLVLDAALLEGLPRDWAASLRDLPGGLELPVLALASAQEDSLLLDPELEFQDRIAKPLESRELRHRLELMLRLARARTQMRPEPR